jgi:hypothetical protein
LPVFQIERIADVVCRPEWMIIAEEAGEVCIASAMAIILETAETARMKHSKNIHLF